MGDIDVWTDDIHQGDVVETLRDLPESSVHMAMCSPPYYGLRDYGADGQIGLEDTMAEYIDRLVGVGDELQRVLRDDGSWWLNLGDGYARKGGWSQNNGLDGVARGESDRAKSNIPNEGKTQYKGKNFREKNKMLIPHRTAIALQEAGWIVRNDVVWAKPNPKPESATDRLSTTFEFVFHLTPGPNYWYDQDAICQPNGANPGDIFEVSTKPYPDAHFAVYPPELCEKPIKATCPEGGIVLDPFAGAGTTCLVAKRLGRRFIGIDLNPEYVAMAQARVGVTVDNPDLLTDDGQAGLSAYAPDG